MLLCVCFSDANLVWGGVPADFSAASCISIVVRRQSAAVAMYDGTANELSCAEYVRIVPFAMLYFCGGAFPWQAEGDMRDSDPFLSLSRPLLVTVDCMLTTSSLSCLNWSSALVQRPLCSLRI